MNADAAQVGAANDTRQRSDALQGHVDLAEFVRAAIAGETADTAARVGVLQLPADWTMGLDDLPGYDAATGTLRITDKRNRLRDGKGRSLAFLGRAHPVVRRAISSVRRIEGSACDNRVSAACADDGASLSLLLCFSAELRSGRGVELQRIITVLVEASGAAIEICDPERWQHLADKQREITAVGLWRDSFAEWVAHSHADAEAVATKAMHRIVTEFTSARQGATDREAVEMGRWLKLRADGICGAFVPRTPDLFGDMPRGVDWQLLSAPTDRLSAFAADGGNPPGRRREADSVVALFQRRTKERETRAAMSPPVLIPVSMLMLVPPGCGA
jgi:hypothetical protein